MFVKQSTAATFIVGPILDSAGAEYDSAVIGDLSISKNGGTLTALAAAATLTLIANGQYTLVLRTTDADTLGQYQITCNKVGYQMPALERHVVPANIYDALVTGTDFLKIDAVEFAGATITQGFATGPALATAQADLDKLTGADGAILATSQPNYAPSQAGDAMALTPAERTTTAAVLEAAILDEGDATALLAAIAAKVEEFLINEGDATATIAAIATACNAAVAAGQVGIDAAAIKAAATEARLSELDAANLPADIAATKAVADLIEGHWSGAEIFGHSAIDSFKRIEVASGNATLSGAGTGTEILTSEDASLTATFTVDGSGNVSAIVWA